MSLTNIVKLVTWVREVFVDGISSHAKPLWRARDFAATDGQQVGDRVLFWLEIQEADLGLRYLAAWWGKPLSPRQR